MKSLHVALIALCAATACAGSQSETPWPAEPPNAEAELVGEAPRKGNVVNVDDLPNRYGQGGGAAAEDEETLEEKARAREDREKERDAKRLERSRKAGTPNNDPMRPRGRMPMTP